MMLATEFLTVDQIKFISAVLNFVILGGLSSAFIWLWMLLPELKPDVRQFVIGALFLLGAAVLRVGWWMPSMWFAEPAKFYNAYLETWKFLPYIASSSLVLCGMGLAYTAFRPHAKSPARKAIDFGVPLFALGIGLTWMALRR